MKKINVRKDFARLYNPKERPSILEVPTFKRIYIKGIGSETDQNYAKSVDALYAIAYYIKTKLVDSDLFKFKHFVVSPLEVIWTQGAETRSFEAFINMPNFVNDEAVELVKKYLQEDDSKENDFIGEVLFDEQTEGKVIQALHLKSFENQEETLDAIKAHAKANDLEVSSESIHKIYLGDLRKLRVENWKTLLRLKVK